ncbi:MAG: DUF896 domain-containing protein [Acidaminococcaceae bacterium]
MKELIVQINNLAHKKRTVGLTPTELSTQKLLYRQYLDLIRGQVINHLDNIEIVDTPTVKH